MTKMADLMPLHIPRLYYPAFRVNARTFAKWSLSWRAGLGVCPHGVLN